MVSSTRPGPEVLALREPPSGDWWEETQWKVFLALLDAVVTPVVADAELTDPANQKKIPRAQYDEAAGVARQYSRSPELLGAFLRSRPSDDPAFVHSVRRFLSNVPAAERQQLGGILSTLANPVGALLVTGYCTPVHEQPVHVREAILQSWTGAWMARLRVLVRSLSTVAQMAFVQTSPLFKQITGYSDVPHDWAPVQGFEYQFLQFEPADEPAVVEADVVIVGSGCGGAVCAKTLAEAGHRVVVVDKGYHFPPSQLPMPQQQATNYLFENGGVVSSADHSVDCVAGSCWGGGGVVNWSVSLQTQDYVRREWARKDGLAFFETQDFQDCLDRVCAVMGVSQDNVEHGQAARVLLDGGEKLGYGAAVAPQNCGGKAHPCGHCHYGCGSAGKRGTAVTWLPAAARAGATFIEGLQAELTLDGNSATGIRGTWVSRDASGSVSGPLDQRLTRDVVVKAKKVIVSCGTLWSPLVLMKAGLQNPHIGRNLHLHPVNFVAAFFDKDTRGWESGIITSYCSGLENLDNNGHGVKLETSTTLPVMVLATLPWRSGLDFKLAALRCRQLTAFISLCRDRDTGRVLPDAQTGRPRIEYTPSAFDRAHVLEGVVALAKMCYVTGATEIRAFLPGVEPFVRRPGAAAPNVDDPDFAIWLGSLRSAGNAPPTASFGSAHQMGTCRMSSRPEDGVIDPRGRVWGAENLYVADASVFPSASGVNPMVTNMAIADWIARGVARDLDESKSAGAKLASTDI